jgi:hypothetical protein
MEGHSGSEESGSGKRARTKKTAKPPELVVAAPRAARKKPPAKTARAPTADERYSMIAEAAYLRAEKRGFKGGDPAADWLEAEREVDSALAS